MADIVNVDLVGRTMSQVALDGLRERLGLDSSGRLDDSEDIGFGSRVLRDDHGGWVLLELRRDYEGDYATGLDDDWSLVLCASDAAAVDEATIRRVRAEFLAAAEAFGFTGVC